MNKFNKTALIGYTGFVGSNLYYDYKFTDVYNTKNINDIINKEYDCVICAGINAKKWYANLYPAEDYDKIIKLLNILKKVKIHKFILISTIDIYDKLSSGYDEDYESSPNNNFYGKHRLNVEKFIKINFQNYHIIRLSGLFGYGLKKNIIYDYLNKTLKEININSSFQWYYLNDLYNDINYIINNDIKLINLFNEPIPNYELMSLFNKIDNNYNINITNKNLIIYNCKTKYSKTNIKYWKNKIDVINQLDNYLLNMTNNNLIISNLSWKHNDNIMMLNILKEYGINELEIAPYKYLNGNFDIIKREFNIYSFQSILYPLNENLFESQLNRDKLEKHIIKIINIAESLDVKILVFGSPKNRKKNNLTYEESLNISIPFFKKLAEYAFSKNIVICIEPNPKIYDCDFIINSKQGKELVDKVNSYGFKLHLDIGCMLIENENILDTIKINLDILKHIHFSSPYLKTLLSNNKLDYKYLFNEIKKIYKYKISIEMLNQSDYDIIKDIRYILS